MFNDSFYPTPASLAYEIIQPYAEIIKKGSLILEPSAGKGDISRVLTGISRKVKVHQIEIEPELQSIARNYGPIVGTDFLEFEPDCEYDFIIMNPPFSNGDEHLLHAWEIAGNTTIIAIINAETLKNPYSSKRKALLSIIEANGSYYFVENAFANAERKTGVEIAVVTLHKKKESGFSFHDFEQDTISCDDYKEMSLATPDIIENMVQDYRIARELYSEGIAKLNRAKAIASRFGYIEFDKIESYSSSKDSIIGFDEAIRSVAWNKIFEATGMRKYMTEKVLLGFQEKMKQQGSISVTRKNIKDFIAILSLNAGNILEESIVTSFEYLTRYTEDNTFIPEGWAHNNQFMINKKFILPGMVDLPNRFHVYGRNNIVDDIDKAMAYMTGKNYSEIIKISDTINSIIDNYKNTGDLTEGESEFFKIKIYKKGTAHFTFKNKSDWIEFNVRATKSKGWIPPSQEGKWRQSNCFK